MSFCRQRPLLEPMVIWMHHGHPNLIHSKLGPPSSPKPVYLPSCTTQVLEPLPCSHHSHQNEPTSHVLLMCVHKYSFAKLCPTLCNSMDRSPSGSPVRVISQVRILE